MIELGSLIGFALVFVAVTWASQAVLVGGLLAARERLRRLGPRAERRAASIALALPVALGVAASIGLAGFSLLGPALGAPDHCLEDGHHLHLCLRHGADWTAASWGVAVTAGLGALLVVRVSRGVADAWRASHRLRILRAVSSERLLADGTTLVCAPSRQPFCFTAGLRTPRVYVGTATLARLGDDQQTAMLAHERAHVAFGDLWRGTVLSALTVVGAPVAATLALARWRDAGERLCDRVAADAIGSPETVASAILAFARAPACTTGFAFVPHPSHVVDRVEALLADAPRGDRTARRFGVAAVAALGCAVVGATLLADPLHHAIETLLGSL